MNPRLARELLTWLWMQFANLRQSGENPAFVGAFECVVWMQIAAPTAKRDWLMGALDVIDGRFVTWTAVTASQGLKRDRKMRSEIRWPGWTSDIAQVPTVRA